MSNTSKTKHLISPDAGWNQHELPLPSSTYDWNFNRFMDEYNKLYATLNHLDEVKLFSGDMSIQRGEDASKHEVLVQEFVERSQQVANDLPHLKEDILCRVELMTAKWDIIQKKDKGIHPDKNVFDIGGINQAIPRALDWMCSLEENLEPMKFNVKWSAESIGKKINEIKSYQDEIKLHGKWIKSLLRKCEDKCEWDAIKDLEERWHKIRLRILEWQYFLEGLTWTDSYKVSPIKEPTLTDPKCDLKRGSSNLDSPELFKQPKFSRSSYKRTPDKMERCTDPMDFKTSSPLKAKAASPNCAAYFFKHGHHHPASVGVSDCQDNPSMTKTSSATIGSEADVHELVNRADELLLKNASRNCADDGNRQMESRDASGEEGSSADDDDDDVRRSEENDVGGRMDEESDDSSCSHDMTLTMTSSSTSCGGGVCTVEDNKASKELKDTALAMKEAGENDDEIALLDSERDHEEKNSNRRLSTRGCKQHMRTDEKTCKTGSETDISEAELSEYWDQEKYLSEHHYDEQVDEDAALRILNFGDDYRNYIDSLSDGLSSCSEKKRPKKKFRKYKYEYPPNIDSGSECEVTNTGLENIFDVFTMQYEELGTKASSACQLSNFNEVWNQLEHCVKMCQEGSSDLTSAIEGAIKDERIHLGKKDQRKYKVLSRRWNRLRLFCKEALVAIKSYQELRESLDSMQDVLEVCSKTVDDSSNDESTLQAVIVKLSGYKSDLFNINLGVHGLLAGRGVLIATAPTNTKEDETATQEDIEVGGRQGNSRIPSINEELTKTQDGRHATGHRENFFEEGYNCLKTAVVRLYAHWDNVLQRANSSLIRIDQLNECRKRDAEEEISRRLGDLGSFQNVDDPLRGLNEGTKKVISPITSTSSKEKDGDKKPASNGVLSNECITPPEQPFWIRVLYKAAPWQLILLLLWISSWLVGPTCCDYSNHTHFLTPQLQFFNGPPPI